MWLIRSSIVSSRHGWLQSLFCLQVLASSSGCGPDDYIVPAITFRENDVKGGRVAASSGNFPHFPSHFIGQKMTHMSIANSYIARRVVCDTIG